MATVDFEVEKYNVTIAREYSSEFRDIAGNLVTISWRAGIVCSGGGYNAIFYFVDAPSQMVNNSFMEEYNLAAIFLPLWQYEWCIDLLRNEKPVYCYLDNEDPNSMGLYTGNEPVGEFES